ncbi:type II toxin-antitoxin system RelE/ParE family toxin [Methyloprofundus sp.]|uniref:type II toxin-antitoxin system RelE/ParE family toxin n=1 Tax=Methyloprofundus sp. TaxID=2020875 RepID=UPI003D0C0ADC
MRFVPQQHPTNRNKYHTVFREIRLSETPLHGFLNKSEFDKWFSVLKDSSVKQKVLARLARIENGNFGDFKKVSSNLFELRFFFSSGIRIYYTIHNKLVLLLSGGDKSSQSKDIDTAKQILNELE